jgi:hypothetical protein
MKLAAILCIAAATIACCSPSGARETVRSRAALRQFARSHMCPSTHRYRLPCPGYVVDHRVPLDCGGPDHPSNMQYQTIAEGKAKDKWERSGPGCKHRTKG